MVRIQRNVPDLNSIQVWERFCTGFLNSAALSASIYQLIYSDSLHLPVREIEIREVENSLPMLRKALNESENGKVYVN